MQWPLLASLFTILCTLQGCTIDAPVHEKANWRTKDSYLTAYEAKFPGEEHSTGRLNSCQMKIPPSLQCSGHGACKDFMGTQTASQSAAHFRFCDCDPAWSDPECRTPRKSQMTAFLYSVFLGFFGADQFYLGFLEHGVWKIISLGGLGLWYIYDIVRIGSSQVLTKDGFPVAIEISHDMFILALYALAMFWGFFFAVISIWLQRVLKARRLLLLLHTTKLNKNHAEAGSTHDYGSAEAPTSEHVAGALRKDTTGLHGTV